MTPRQQRRLEQKLARKAQKLEDRRQNQLTHEISTEPVDSLQTTQSLIGPESIGFESQNAAAAAKPSISPARLAANRANAQHSCGPKTAEGKQIVSQNRTRHGLTGNFRVLPDECQADFDRLVETLLREEVPADDTEAEFVQQIAEALWLSRRSVRLQDKCLVALESGTPEEQRVARKDLALFIRYQITHERAFVRYATELRKRRNERRRVERGFESQIAREAQQERRAAAEKRKQELHEIKISIQKARYERLQTPKKVAAASDQHLAAAA